MKRTLAIFGLIALFGAMPTVANGPDPMPGCSPSCKRCCPNPPKQFKGFVEMNGKLVKLG